MPGKTFFLAGSVFGFLGVAAGAFGAHALKARLSPEMLTVFETGCRYQLFHAVVLLFIALAMGQSSSPLFRSAGWLIVFGILIFSGSLYTLTLSGVRAWGAVTPIGGLLLLAGWALLIFAAVKK